MFYALYALLSYALSRPLLVLAGLALAFVLIDRRFIGLLPDLAAPFRRRRHLARLREESSLNPANASAQAEIGAIYLEKGQPRQALTYLEKARERMEDSARINALLGACYRALGRAEEAGTALHRAVELNPKVGYGEPYYLLLGLTLREGKKEEEREDLLDKILHYGSSQVFYLTGRLLLRAGLRPEACRMFQEALDNYQASPKGLRRAHRRWAAAAKLYLYLSR